VSATPSEPAADDDDEVEVCAAAADDDEDEEEGATPGSTSLLSQAGIKGFLGLNSNSIVSWYHTNSGQGEFLAVYSPTLEAAP
jgi:hypothetical protein